MKLKESLDKKKFIVTSEIQAPIDEEPEALIKRLELIRGRVDGIAVPELEVEGVVWDSIKACSLLKQNRVESIYQTTTRDKSRPQLQKDLLLAHEAGVENLLVFTEDYRITGDSLQEMMFFHVDAGKLSSVLEHMQEGYTVDGKELPSKAEFVLGSGVESGWGKNVPDLEMKEMEEMTKIGTGYFLTTPVFDLAVFEKIIRVNFFGSVYCTHYALPYLKKTRGRLVGVSSLRGKLPSATADGYGASKHAMAGFFDSLRLELPHSGVSVTMIYPGWVSTGITSRALRVDGKLTGEISKHEDLMNKTIELRSRSGKNSNPGAEKIVNEHELSAHIKQLFLIGNHYDELGKSTNFLELKKEISDMNIEIENLTSDYNKKVRHHNSVIKRPYNVVPAIIMRYKKKNIFEFE